MRVPVIVGLIALASCQKETKPAPRIANAANVVMIQGTVKVANVVAVVGTPLFSDDVVETGPNSLVAITVNHNNARWDLGPNKRVRLNESLAWIAPVQQPGPPPSMAPRDPPTAPPKPDACTLGAVIGEIADPAGITCPAPAGGHHPAPESVAAFHRCIVDAVKARKPFSSARGLDSIDSDAAEGWVGRQSSGRYEIYSLHYSRSAGCLNCEHGTSVVRCDTMISAEDCYGRGPCLYCIDVTAVGRCVLAAPGPVTLPATTREGRPLAALGTTLHIGADKVVSHTLTITPESAEVRAQLELPTWGEGKSLGTELRTSMKDATVTLSFVIDRDGKATRQKLRSSRPGSSFDAFLKVLPELRFPASKTPTRVEMTWKLTVDSRSSGVVIAN